MQRKHGARIVVILITWVCVLAALGYAQDVGLSRPISLTKQRSSLGTYLLDVLRKGNVSGGVIAVSTSCDEIVEDFPEYSGTVQGLFQELASSGRTLHWSQSGEHVVVWNTPSVPSVLLVTVHEFRFSRKEALTKVSSDLFGDPEVQNEVRQRQLVERAPEMGFAKMPEPSADTDFVTLRNAQVLDILNSAAGTHSVWFYRESRCARNQMSLNWPVR